MSPMPRTLAIVLLMGLWGNADVARCTPLRLGSGTIQPTSENGTTLLGLITEIDSAPGGHFLVQFDHIPPAPERDRLSSCGIDLLHYIPENGYVAWVSRGAAGDPTLQHLVRWASTIPGTAKLCTSLRQGRRPENAITPDGRLRLLVKTFPDVDSAAGRRAIEQVAEVQHVSPAFRRYQVVVAADRVNDLAALDPVECIELIPPSPTDWVDGSRLCHQVNEVQSAPYHLTGFNVDVGQIEGRNPDHDHLDLDRRVDRIQILGEGVHATMVAGIIIGDGTNSEAEGGTPLQWRGMATEAEIDSWSYNGYLDRYDTAINTYGVDLSNNSWGYYLGGEDCDLYGDYSDEAAAMDQIITGFYGRRIPIVFAAGNSRDACECGMSCDFPYVNYFSIAPPGATAKNTITVGARLTDTDELATFSGFGPMDDGRLKPEIVAGGDQSDGDLGITCPIPDDAYGVDRGTSLAAPVVAGCAALFIEDYRALVGSDPLPSTLKAHFCHTAEDLDVPTWSFLNPGPDYASGYGSLRVKEAIDQLRGGNWVEGTVDQGESDIYSLEVPATATAFRATLAWDDEAGTPLADPALVNDLDLVVLDPSLTRHYPWVLDPAHPGDPAQRSVEDSVNPLEQVLADGTIVSGSWSIEVRGTAVPLGPQDYSLIFSYEEAASSVAPPPSAPGLRATQLHASHPNPFGPWTVISYTLGEEAEVRLRVVDVRGRQVRELVPGLRQSQGNYTYTWRGRDDAGRELAGGVYFVELRAGAMTEKAKIILVR